ncbi:malto-oligosyltrehalose synthase [Agromyces sp. MMS24-K17]|uniref:malto-oligosyltrehalose synthase n=1 Tax=Agromyces sp. MMS24-K17 TaxID=3372850 RepID=UPI003754E905
MARTPRSTYRLQVRAAFDLDAVAGVTDYLHDLGADWIYLSPLLAATAGSDHGYDVVDHSRVDPARGGADGLARAVAAARERGLGVLVDIVPNHMGVSDASQNAWWWDLLRHGRGSRYAEAFDVDWAFGNDRVRLPVLGGPVEQAVAAGDLRVEGEELRYFEHRFPIAPETDASLLEQARGGVSAAERAVAERAEAVLAVHAAQHYELMDWHRADDELDYRRFFAVSTLAGIRVEVPWVFDESHAEILRWIREGLADGLRVDHPDGLADPGGYLARLAEATGGAYVLVEKILEHGERLPAGWAADGTTGYDALADLDRVFVDPAGEGGLTRAARPDAGDAAGAGRPEDWTELIHGTKRGIADGILRSEVLRLVRLLPRPVDGADDAIAELLTDFPVYRSYLVLGGEHLDRAEASARARRPELAAALDEIAPLLRDPDEPIARRFQQTSGMVMAKGVEDTAFYRYTRLGTLTEVGGDPSEFAITPAEFHERAERRHAAWPDTMTTLSTHDTKRGEDVRARLSVLSELPDRWALLLAELRPLASTGSRPLDALLWQAIVGAWPVSRERLHAYAEKAAREAGDETSWADPDAAFERRLHALVDAAFDDEQVAALVTGFVEEVAAPGWSNSLGAKLLQLLGPGVPDVYQGSELWEQSLVDPDNRRPVDFDVRRGLLRRLDGGWLPPVDETGAAKLLVVSRALRLRRDRPDLFTRYTPFDVVGEASEHAIAFDRGGAVAVATRLPVGLAARGPDPWGDTVLLRHAGPTIDLLTGRRFDEPEVPLGVLLERYPVALLGPAEAGDAAAGDAAGDDAEAGVAAAGA